MESIGGTVIQRSFIGANVGNVVHIATAPLDELALDETDLVSLISEITGTPPAAVLSEEDYRSYLKQIDSFSRKGPFGPPRRRPLKAFEELPESNHPLFQDFVLYLSSSSASLNLSFDARYFYYELEFRGADEIEDIDKFLLSAQFDSARYYAKDSNIRFVTEIASYEIPSGQSPAIKSDSLINLLETSRKFCVAPLVVGGAQAVSQLSQGLYVAALLTTGTAGVMTLMLIGTVTVGTLLVQRVAQVRARRGGERPDDERTPPPRAGGRGSMEVAG